MFDKQEAITVLKELLEQLEKNFPGKAYYTLRLRRIIDLLEKDRKHAYFHDGCIQDLLMQSEPLVAMNSVVNYYESEVHSLLLKFEKKLGITDVV